jgi:hypothetical protein
MLAQGENRIVDSSRASPEVQEVPFSDDPAPRQARQDAMPSAGSVRQTGMAISHTSPSSRHSGRMSPFSEPMTLFMTRVPKP